VGFYFYSVAPPPCAAVEGDFRREVWRALVLKLKTLSGFLLHLLVVFFDLNFFF
jgi:hypothetical protein